MAISTSPGNFWSASSSADIYDGQRYYAEQEQRYRQEMERQRYAAAQNAYDHNTQMYRGMAAQQMQEASKPVKAQTPAYLDNNKLLLLEN